MNNENNNSEIEKQEKTQTENIQSNSDNEKNTEKKGFFSRFTKKQVIIVASAIGAVVIASIVAVICIILFGGKGGNNNDNPANADPGEHICVWTVESVLQEQSCTNDGVINYSCFCGEKKTSINKAVGHKFSEWSTAKTASCTTYGEELRTCTVCGANDTKVSARLEHDYEIKDDTILGVAAKIFDCKKCRIML